MVLASTSFFYRNVFQVDEEIEEYQMINMKGVKSRVLDDMFDLGYNGKTQVKQRECEEFINVMWHYKVLKDIPRREEKNKYFSRAFCKVGPD